MNRIILIAGGALAFFAATAYGGNLTVTALTNPNRFEFDPPTAEIHAGDTVTFVNGGGFHNAVSDADSVTAFRCANGCDGDGGNGDASNASWTASVVFPTAGTAPFHCEVHGAEGGVGMSGTITILPAVTSTLTVTALTNPNRFEFDPPSAQIHAGDTVTFVNGGGFHNAVSDSDSVTAFRCANGCDGDGGNGDASSDPWTADVVFPTAGTAPFHCEVHGAEGGVGMSGTITILPAGPAPIIGVDPNPIGASATEGASTIVAMTIGNTGDADLTWTADTASTDCTTPDLVPWLSLAPTSGTVIAGDPAANVDVTLDAATLTAGVYNANVCVHSNDTAHDPVTVPVVFTVNIPDLIFIDGFDG